MPTTDAPHTETAIFAGGCFWCVEAVFREIAGVLTVEPGYCGGSAENAHYHAVCSGKTGHAEVIRIHFDNTRIRYTDLLRVFLTIAHDPTQKDRQGNDRGTQYRSAIFYKDSTQKTQAQAAIDQITTEGLYKDPIVTTLEPLKVFYVAEDYHHDYAIRNPDAPYIMYVATPKVLKLRQHFKSWLKEST